jgi:3-oxoacyl-(acyl-carrier-protein) synthase
MPVEIEIVKYAAFTPQGFDFELFDRLCNRTSDPNAGRAFDWGADSIQKGYRDTGWVTAAAAAYMYGLDRRRVAHFYATTKALAPEEAPAQPLDTLDFEVPTTLISNACVSSAQAVIEAVDALRDGDCDLAVVTASDVVTNFVEAGFQSLQAKASSSARPFDRRRDGLTLGSAYADVFLSRAAGRSHRPRIIAYGCSNDANHISGPSRDGAGLALAIERAIVGVDRREIRAICAHGTATQYNDAMEARAFHTVFGGSAPPVFGIKGAIGHTLGAAGLIEVIISAKVATEGVIPPTTGYEHGETDFPLDVVHGKPRKIKPGLVLTTNSGFGGMNTAIIVGPGNA